MKNNHKERSDRRPIVSEGPRTSPQRTVLWHELLDPGTRTALLLSAGIAAMLLFG